MKVGRPPKGDAALSPAERQAAYRQRKIGAYIGKTSNLFTEYEIECFALEQANEVYMNVKKELFIQHSGFHKSFSISLAKNIKKHKSLAESS